MNKIFKAIYYVFLGCIVAIAILLIVSVFPLTGNYKFMIVQSGSMEPTIHTGSVVVVKPAAQYQIGDIITFGKNTKTQVPTTHRIAEMRLQNGQPVYITKGDANNGSDQKEITGQEILGKVRFSVPYIGFAVATAKQPAGFVLLIVLPAALIIFDELKKILLEIRNLKKRKDEERLQKI